MSDTLRKLVATSFQFGKTGKGVLTTQEAYERALVTKTLVTISSIDQNVFFFTDDHIFGYDVLPKGFVPSTSSFPMYVTPRENLPDGMIMTTDQFIDIFQRNYVQITTIEELVELLDGESLVL